MKKVTTILAVILLAAVSMTAQTLSYSAVVRNSANELVANQTITVAVSIANSETGAAVYSETHNNVQTNQNGLVSLTIGDGTVVGGDFANVNWTTAYITTQYTLPDGSSLVSTMPVNAVPYALYADNISPESLLGAVSAMTDEQKAALKEALGVTGGSDAPTTFTCGTSKMTDADGNEYETVLIGTQCWTKTNMREPVGTQGLSITDTSYTAPYYYDISESNLPLATRGYLYNWPAANQVCPTGWHLPTVDEWILLVDYLSNAQEGTNYLYRCFQSDATSIAKALASTEGWNSYSGECYPGDQTMKPNNTSGFSAVPVGMWSQIFLSEGGSAFFWSSTEFGTNSARLRFLGKGRADLASDNCYRYGGLSVRCLR